MLETIEIETRPNPDAAVIFTGFQSQGTLGRRLVNREPSIRIFGEEIAVRAQVYTIGGFSAHAGRTQLVDWVLRASPRRVVTYHGEPEAQDALATAIERASRETRVTAAVFGKPIEV